MVAKGLTAAAIVAPAVGLATLFERDARSFPTVLLAEACCALAFSGLLRGLHQAHRASMGFMGALPLAPGWWRPFDLAAVLMATLLCALRAPQLISERRAVVLAAAVAGCWTAATIACLL